MLLREFSFCQYNISTYVVLFVTRSSSMYGIIASFFVTRSSSMYGIIASFMYDVLFWSEETQKIDLGVVEYADYFFPFFSSTGRC